MEQKAAPEFECCPPFDPTPWDNQLFNWENKRFIKDHVCTFFYMPVNFGKVIIRLYEKIKASQAEVPDWMCLSDHTSRWNMDLYLAVDREIAGAKNTTLCGRFYSKVYEGPYKETGKWCKDYEAIVHSKGMKIRKWYMWYTTCPKCAKKYGKNYVAIIAEVAEL